MTVPASTLGQRLAERQASEAEGAPPPAATARDRDALRAFEVAAAALAGLLSEEIAAIEAWRLDLIDGLSARKTALVQALEARHAAVEPFLRAAIAADPGLRDRLVALDDLVKTDGRLLSRLAEAAETIAREHARILDRHSLNGLYQKSGRKRGAARPPHPGLDESH